MQTLYDNVDAVQSLDSGKYTSNTDGQSNLDTFGSVEDVMAVFNVGDLDNADGDETYTLVIQEDDNSSFSSPSDVKTVSLDRANDDNTIQVIELEGVQTDRERYLRARVEVGGTSPSIHTGAVLLSQRSSSPVR